MKELIGLGDINALGAEIGERHGFDDPVDPARPWCRAYHRDLFTKPTV